MKHVLFLSRDLIFASRVRAAAEQSDVLFKLANRWPESIDLEDPQKIPFKDMDIGWVVLDLSTLSSIPETLVGDTQQYCPDAQLIAYGPHVQAGKLKRARDAGISKVLTRSQFDSALPSIFQTTK